MNLYIHIPFCHSKCSYCHFYSTCNLDLIDQYLGAVIVELKQHPQISPKTVYLGGGTPSLLTPTQLNRLFSQINLSQTKEITIEAHPDTLSKAKIDAYLHLNINRLSLGIQSWHTSILKNMNRSYSTSKVRSIIEYAQNKGLDNINIDHIISYPYQTDQMLLSDLDQTLSLRPTHISIYPLERHPHTRIKKSPSSKKIVRQFGLAQNLLHQHGYLHYEELNFCLPHFECQHNLHFWQGKDYLGVGASAVSKIGRQIKTNTSNINTYIADPINSSQHTGLTSSENNDLIQDLKQRLLLYT